jgi:hypothetical protein
MRLHNTQQGDPSANTHPSIFADLPETSIEEYILIAMLLMTSLMLIEYDLTRNTLAGCTEA